MQFFRRNADPEPPEPPESQEPPESSPGYLFSKEQIDASRAEAAERCDQPELQPDLQEPSPGITIVDPAVGTGGFLAEGQGQIQHELFGLAEKTFEDYVNLLEYDEEKGTYNADRLSSIGGPFGGSGDKKLKSGAIGRAKYLLRSSIYRSAKARADLCRKHGKDQVEAVFLKAEEVLRKAKLRNIRKRIKTIEKSREGRALEGRPIDQHTLLWEKERVKELRDLHNQQRWTDPEIRGPGPCETIGALPGEGRRRRLRRADSPRQESRRAGSPYWELIQGTQGVIVNRIIFDNSGTFLRRERAHSVEKEFNSPGGDPSIGRTRGISVLPPRSVILDLRSGFSVWVKRKARRRPIEPLQEYVDIYQTSWVYWVRMLESGEIDKVQFRDELNRVIAAESGH